jgi:hypothetical protein
MAEIIDVAKKIVVNVFRFVGTCIACYVMVESCIANISPKMPPESPPIRQVIMPEGTRLLIIRIKAPSTRYCFKIGLAIIPKVIGRVKQRNIIKEEIPSAPKQLVTTHSTSTNTKPANTLDTKRSAKSTMVRVGP